MSANVSFPHLPVERARYDVVRPRHPPQVEHVAKVAVQRPLRRGGVQAPDLDGGVHRAGGEGVGAAGMAGQLVHAARVGLELDLGEVDGDVER